MKRIAMGIISSLIIFLCACGGPKYSVRNLPTNFVEMGNGGGFTGAYTYYKIASNGQVFTSKSGDTAYAEYGVIAKKTAKNAFKILGKMKDKSISKPGNLNYFIFRAEGDSMTSWLWSDDKTPSEEILTIYTALNEAISALPASNK